MTGAASNSDRGSNRVRALLVVLSIALVMLAAVLIPSGLAYAEGQATWVQVGQLHAYPDKDTFYAEPGNHDGKLYPTITNCAFTPTSDTVSQAWFYGTKRWDDDGVAYTASCSWSMPPSSILVGHEDEISLSGSASRSDVYVGVSDSGGRSYISYITQEVVYVGAICLLYRLGDEDENTGYRDEWLTKESRSGQQLSEETTGKTEFANAHYITDAYFGGVIVADEQGEGYDPGAIWWDASAQGTFEPDPEEAGVLVADTRYIANPSLSYEDDVAWFEPGGTYLLIIGIETSNGSKLITYYTYSSSAEGVVASNPFVTEDNPFVEDVTIETVAPKDKGKTGGWIIPLAIVGALIVAGGAVAVGRRRKYPKGELPPVESAPRDNEPDEPDEPSSFRMQLYKEFGDTLYVDGGEQTIGALVEEVKPHGGGVVARDDLTARISFGVSENLAARAIGMQGHYQCVNVEALNADKPTAIVEINFAGDGASFANRVEFKVEEPKKPEVVFPALTEDGKNWIVNANLSTIDMVAGAGGTDRVRFLFTNTEVEPTEIRFLNHDGFEISYEKDEHPLAYWAVIENQTEPAEKEGGVFSDMRDCTFTVEGDFPNGETARGNFGVYLYPQGLSVLKTSGPNKIAETTPGFEPRLKDGWLQVISYLTRERDALTLDPLIRPTGFDLCYAKVQLDGTASVEMEDGPFRFEKLKATDEDTENILAKYRYEVGPYASGYAMRPEDSVPEMGEAYYVYLPVSAGDESIEIPIRLIGEPFDPKKDWKAEYQGLEDLVRRYFPEDVAPGYLEYVDQNYNDPNVWSLDDLRTVRYDLIRASQSYWTHQRENQLGLVKYYDSTEWIFKKPARFVGDVAFRIVVRFYCGEGENWITPVKDLIIDSVDDAIWSYHFTGKAEWNVVEHALEQATNAFENFVSVSDSKGFVIGTKAGEVPKLVIALFGFLVADCVQNYYKMNPRDFYEALRKTFFDTSLMSVRKILGAGLQKAMNSEVVKKFFQHWFFSMLNCFVPGAAQASLVLTDPKTGKALLDDTGAPEKVGRIIIDNWDYKPVFANGAGQIIQIGTDKRVLPSAFVTLEEAQRMLAPAGLSSELFQSLEIMGDQVVSYREVVQRVLDKLFSDGVAKIGEWTDVDASSEWFGAIRIPVLWGSGDRDCITIDVARLFTDPIALASKAFELLYQTLFGWFELPKDKPSDDPGKEALKS